MKRSQKIIAACEEALRLDSEATPGPWLLAGVDAGDGRMIEYADYEPRLAAIRVSCPGIYGAEGSCRSVTPAQRDRDAEFIAGARRLLPILASALNAKGRRR